jgi:cobalt-zinc-cadmium resistance protein CzcA
MRRFWPARAAPVPFILGGAGVLAAAMLGFGLLGQEFMPQLDEKDITVTNFRVPSVSIDQSTQMQMRIENALKSLPEVALVFSKNGNADLGTDPMPPNASDTYVIPKPEKEWPAEVKSKEDIIRRIEETMKPLIGNRTEIQQPIQMRFNELIAGVRADVAVKLYGDDLDQMTAQGQRIAAILRKIPGVTSAWSRPRALPPSTSRSTAWRRRVSAFRCRRSAIPWPRRWAGVRRGWCLKATGALPWWCACPMFSATIWRCWVRSLSCCLPGKARSPARSLCVRWRFSYTQGLNQISRENGKRMVTVQVNVRGRDLGGFVKEAQAKIGAIDLPPGMYIGWGGTFESLQSARLRLMLVVPVCFAAIYGLLWLALGGFARAAIVFSAVPMALAGGVFALLRGIPFDHGGGGVHRFVGCGGAQWARHDGGDPPPPR